MINSVLCENRPCVTGRPSQRNTRRRRYVKCHTASEHIIRAHTVQDTLPKYRGVRASAWHAEVSFYGPYTRRISLTIITIVRRRNRFISRKCVLNVSSFGLHTRKRWKLVVVEREIITRPIFKLTVFFYLV